MAWRALGCPAKALNALELADSAASPCCEMPADAASCAAAAALRTVAASAAGCPESALKPAALAASALNTFGSALSACIALLSPASCWNAEALLAMLALDAAFDAASRKAFAFDAKWP